MRGSTERFASAVVGSHRATSRVASWRGTELLDDSIPFAAGDLSHDDTQEIPGAITLNVPVGPDRQWDPTGDPFHPLAPFGQRLYVSRGIVYPGGESELIGNGWYLITDSEPDPLGEGVQVRAASLERLLFDAKLQRPLQPLPGGTFDSEIRRLVGNRIPVDDLDPDLDDRPVPADRVWQDNRLAALVQIATAWPARIVVDAQGLLSFRAPSSALGTPSLELHTGAQGVVAGWATSTTRDTLYNGVWARGEAETADGRAIEGLAWDNNPASPTYFGGPFGENVLEYASPLLTTVAQCELAAQTILEKRLRRQRVALVDMVPDPRIEVGDWVDLSTPTVTGVGRVSGYRMPLNPDGGTASLVVEVAP